MEELKYQYTDDCISSVLAAALRRKRKRQENEDDSESVNDSESEEESEEEFESSDSETEEDDDGYSVQDVEDTEDDGEDEDDADPPAETNRMLRQIADHNAPSESQAELPARRRSKPRTFEDEGSHCPRARGQHGEEMRF